MKQSARRRVLFLYSELAGYMLTAARRFAKLYDVEVHIVRWPVHADAPFAFDVGNWGYLYDRADFDHEGLAALAEQLDAQFVYVAGWMDRGYCKAARIIRRRGVPVVCGMDTQWKGTLRQRVRLMLGRAYIRSCFTHIWAAGAPQVAIAKRLGYSDEYILLGLYTADVPVFAAVYEPARQARRRSYPHTLMYVGRFSPEKGVQDLYRAYRIVESRGTARGWSLKLVGAGKLGAMFTTDGGVTIEGFRKSGVPDLALEAGALILPSRSEAWGVVLHEFAAAGLPLIASDACGARTAYIDATNGRVFKAENIESLAATLEWLFALPDETLVRMGDRSHDLAMVLTPDTWARTAATLLGHGRTRDC